MDDIDMMETDKPLYLCDVYELMERKSRLEKLLSKYAHNKKNLSPEDLKGKYRKPWTRLKEDICDAVQAYSQPILYSAIRHYTVISELAEERDAVIQSVMDEVEVMLKTAVWEKMSVNELDTALETTKLLVQMRLEEFIAPYTTDYGTFSFNAALGAIKTGEDAFWSVPTYC